jgi:hypothetical protein
MIVMEVREAEDLDYGGGQWPGYRECPAAVEAPTTDDTGPQYDFFYANDFAVDDVHRTYRPNDNIGMHGYPDTDDPDRIGLEPTVVGWITVDDWWKYTFNVPEPGAGDPEGGWVKIQVNVAADGVLEMYWDDLLVGTVEYSTGGDYHTYGLFTMEEQFQTTPGEHTLRVKLASGGLNFNKIGIGFNWTKPTREDIFADDFESYTNLYVPDDLIAAGYTVINSSNSDGAYRVWNTAGDFLGSVDPAIDAMTGNYVISDSDLAGDVEADEELITPNIDCTNHRQVRLEFNMNYLAYPDDTTHLQIADVDIRSSDDGVVWGDWVNLLRWDTSTVAESASGPEEVDISANADGKIIQIRFHYYDANFDYWFAVDDLRVSGDKVEVPPEKGNILTIGYVAGVADLTWEVFGPGNYTVQYTADLPSDDWQPVPGVTWPITDTTWSGNIDAIFGQGVYLRVRSE